MHYYIIILYIITLYMVIGQNKSFLRPDIDSATGTLSTMTSMSGKRTRPGASLTGNNAEMCGRCRINTLKYVLLPERQGIVIGVFESRERPE